MELTNTHLQQQGWESLNFFYHLFDSLKQIIHDGTLYNIWMAINEKMDLILKILINLSPSFWFHHLLKTSSCCYEINSKLLQKITFCFEFLVQLN